MHTLFLFTLLFVMAATPGNSAELRLLSADFDPYTYATPTGGSGVMFEVVQELARRVGQSTQVEFTPWARAQVEAQSKPNIGIFPLARVPERESKYVWLIKILEDPYVFFAKKDSKVNISTIEDSKNLRVGVFRGSLAESLLTKWGFKNIETFSNDAQCVRMLKLGRLDAWVAPLGFRGRYKESGGLSAHELRVGASLLILHEYLGASKTIDNETILKWKKAFTSMKADGSYARIMKNYGFKPVD